jgi:hypothetical protein
MFIANPFSMNPLNKMEQDRWAPRKSGLLCGKLAIYSKMLKMYIF